MAEIPLGELVTLYFGGRKEHIPGLPPYSGLRGAQLKFTIRDIKEMPTEKIADGNPFEAVSPETERNAIKVVSHLYNADAKTVKLVELSDMFTGKTAPVRITANVGGVAKQCFAKIPDASRFIGLELYNMLSGCKPLDFIFSELVYVDDKAPGKLLFNWNMKDLFAIPSYVEQRVRLDSVSEVLGLNDLSMNECNSSIDSDGGIYLFDFDEGLKFRKETLISGLPLKPGVIREIQDDEFHLIARRAEKDLGRVQKLVDIMRGHNYHSNEARQYQLEGINNMGDFVAYMLKRLGVPVK